MSGGGGRTLSRRFCFQDEFAHGIRSRSTRLQHQSVEVQQGDGAQEAPVVHARRADRLSDAQLCADPRHRSDPARPADQQFAGRRPRFLQQLHRRCAQSRVGRGARRDALHHCLDRRAARDFAVADARRDQEGRRERPQAPQPIYPLRHRRPHRGPGLFHRLWSPGRRAGRLARDRARRAVHRRRGHLAGRRHLVPDVAGRADHQPRRRQRHLADHHGGHRRRASRHAGSAVRDRAAPVRSIRCASC